LPDSRFLRANGLDLHYLDWGGAQPPALLLHATGFLAAVWGPMADALSGRYRLLAPDQRGHGDSDKPTSGYHRLDFVADLCAFLDALELEGIIGIGHSAGAANIACCEALRPGSSGGPSSSTDRLSAGPYARWREHGPPTQGSPEATHRLAQPRGDAQVLPLAGALQDLA
jgi:pimeloyl-ACP methyl ester carboxylesterase